MCIRDSLEQDANRVQGHDGRLEGREDRVLAGLSRSRTDRPPARTSTDGHEEGVGEPAPSSCREDYVTQFLQQLANGLVLGATYGLIALGYTMVYGIIQLINFAHGEIFMVGALGGLTVFTALPAALGRNVWIALPLVLLGAMATSVVTGVLMERFAYRPLRNAPRLAPLITAIGVSVVLQETIRLFYPGAKAPKPFPRLLPDGAVTLGGVRVAWVSLFVIVVAIALMIALAVFVQTSRTGRAMRATSQDPDTAALMGIDTNRIIVITFVIGACLLYTSDAADEEDSVDLGGRRIIKKQNKI